MSIPKSFYGTSKPNSLAEFMEDFVSEFEVLQISGVGDLKGGLKLSYVMLQEHLLKTLREITVWWHVRNCERCTPLDDQLVDATFSIREIVLRPIYVAALNSQMPNMLMVISTDLHRSPA